MKQTWHDDGNVARKGERVGEISGKKAEELNNSHPFINLLCTNLFLKPI